MKNLLLIFCLVFSSGLKSQNNYFTIGSTENKVLQVQGQPSSITRMGNYSTFIYGSSSVSFTNKLVDGYNNTGNLKIKVSSSVNNTSNKKKPINKSTKKVKWIYFTFITNSNSGYDFDRFSGNLTPRAFEYSKIFSISSYTY